MNNLKCAICGEENAADSKFCSSCGVALSDSKKIVTDDKYAIKTKGKVGHSQKTSVNGKKRNNINQKIVEQETKVLSNTKLFYLVFILMLIGSFILYFSGIFDQPVAAQSPQISENNPHAGVNLANLEQINSLEEKVKSKPNDKDLLLQLAHLLNDSGLKTRAIDEYKEYLRLDSKNADVWVDMGVCYYETGKNQDAISSMERALKIQPRHQIANLNLGIVNMASGNESIALKYWKKAIEIDSTNEIGQKAKELIKSH